MAFAPAFGRPFAPTFDRHAAAAAAAAADWWTAGSAPTPVWVYTPKGAALLSASYSHLVNPGTYDAAPQVAPAFDAGTGWTSDGTKWLLAPSLTYAADQSQVLLVRFSGVSGTGTFIGTGIGDGHFGIAPDFFGGKLYNNGAYTFIGTGAPGTAVMAVAGNQGYLNGATDGATFAATGLPITAAIGIFANNAGGEKVPGSIQAAAYWDTITDVTTWLPLVMAAVALI